MCTDELCLQDKIKCHDGPESSTVSAESRRLLGVWSELPLDCLQRIALASSTMNVASMRLVCRSWRAIYFEGRHASLLKAKALSTCLMVHSPRQLAFVTIENTIICEGSLQALWAASALEALSLTGCSLEVCIFHGHVCKKRPCLHNVEHVTTTVGLVFMGYLCICQHLVQHKHAMLVFT
jgi:hypothetical protein